MVRRCFRHGDGTMDERTRNCRRLFAVGAIAGAVALVAAGGILAARAQHPQGERPVVDHRMPALADASPAVVPTLDKARQVRDAVNRGDFAQARQLIAAVADAPARGWRPHPLGTFLKAVARPSDPAFEEKLDAWAAQKADDAVPLLVRAQYYLDRGWLRRGGRYVAYVQEANMEAFSADMD